MVGGRIPGDMITDRSPFCLKFFSQFIVCGVFFVVCGVCVRFVRTRRKLPAY